MQKEQEIFMIDLFLKQIRTKMRVVHLNFKVKVFNILYSF
jgi:hypothetical protein